MNTFQTIILIALLGNTALALFVFLSNPKRTLNRSFSILASLIAIWLCSMMMGSFRLHDSALLFWTRQTSAMAGLLPVGFFLLYETVANPGISIRRALLAQRYSLTASGFVFILCHSPFFILSANYHRALQVVPTVEYGIGFVVFILYFVAIIMLMAARFLRSYKRSVGVQKEELLFMQMGGCASLIFGVTLLSIGVAFEYQEIGGFLPLSVLVLDGFIAYGIATRRILAASAVLQRVVAYSLMACYLTILYVCAVWIGRYTFHWFVADPSYIAHLTAALVVAFSVSPAIGWMQAIAHHLIPNTGSLNVDDILKRARNNFQEVSTDTNLTDIFALLVKETYGTASLTILRPEKDGVYCQAFPHPGPNDFPLRIESTNPLIKLLRREVDPVTEDILQRMRPSPSVLNARHAMTALGSTAIAGCFIRKDIKAILLLSAKKNGRIYDLHDQRTLQLLCDHFAVALENSNLYTEVQNAKIYNDILLNSLTSGIVAVSADRMVTVFNERAREMTGLDASRVVDHPVSVLPEALAEGLDTVLEKKTGFRDRDTNIQTATGMMPIRVSGETFHSHTGQLLGALVIFTDLTEIKQMEAQIRRSDRLSSIGTLSAGMAHEIKNPLVTIKTFTQLLPDQYKDEEFRQTFFNLVGQEVKRIDTIVNRLLNFARPATATLVPLSLHDVVDGSLQLIAQQLTQNGITLERHLDAARHRINADASQLNQAFINFLLNAVHAMKDGGTLTVRTSLHRPPPDAPPLNGWRNGYCIRLDIEDTGCGIPPENLDRIFDPFFTTKEHGVGLGLSVSHGIIGEHKGIIHVESRQNIGTLFQIHFPLLEESQTEDSQ